MNRIILDLVGFVILLGVFGSVASAAEDKEPTVGIQLAWSSVKLCEPVRVAVTVTNPNQQEAIIADSMSTRSQVYAIGLSGREEMWGESGWFVHDQIGGRPVPMTLRGGATIANCFAAGLFSYGDQRCLFVDPGKYELTGSFGGRRTAHAITVTVEPAEVSEKDAVAELLESQLYWYFDNEHATQFPFTKSHRYDKSRDLLQKDLLDFAANYPQSRYAEWAKLTQLLQEKSLVGMDMSVMHEYQLESNTRTTKQALRVRKSLESIHNRFVALGREARHPPVKAQAYFYAGEIALRFRAKALANLCFGLAASVKGNAILDLQIGEIREHLKGRAAWFVVPPIPPGADDDPDSLPNIIRKY